MAPVRPTSRRRTATTNNQREHVQRPLKTTDSAFALSKKDKRLIKHSSFVNKVHKQNTKLGKKRRRPSKKLVTSLESLADALPEVDQQATTEDARILNEQATIRRKALTSRRGLQKRKEKVDKAERERFSQNLAQIIGSKARNPATEGNPSAAETNTPIDRWQALRNFITQNMDKNC